MTLTVSFKSRRIPTVNSPSKGKLIESSTHAKTWKASAVHAPHLVTYHPNVPKGECVSYAKADHTNRDPAL